MNTIIRSSVH